MSKTSDRMFTRPGRTQIGPDFDYSEGRWERGSMYKDKIGRQTSRDDNEAGEAGIQSGNPS